MTTLLNNFTVNGGFSVSSGSLNSTSVAETANTAITGTFTASDAVVAAPIGDGTIVTGTSTAGSYVYTTIPDGFVAWTLKVTGYVSGTIYTEASNNTTNGTDGVFATLNFCTPSNKCGMERNTIFCIELPEFKQKLPK